MGSVGLLYVGAVLIVNGLMLLGRVDARAAAPLNFFVGAAQVVLPTLVLLQSQGDPDVLAATWPSYLFGFTYLWFGFLTVFRIEPQAFGWYSAFVAAIRPNAYGSSTIGVKKSTVCTSAVDRVPPDSPPGRRTISGVWINSS